MNLSFATDLYFKNGDASPSMVVSAYEKFVDQYAADVKVSIAAFISKKLHPDAKIDPNIDTSDAFFEEYMESQEMCFLKHLGNDYTHDTRSHKKYSFQQGFHRVHSNDADIRPKFSTKILNNHYN